MEKPIRKDFASQELFDKANEEYLLTLAGAGAGTKNQVLPQKRELEGLVTKVSQPVEFGGKTVRFINVGKEENVIISEKIYKDNIAMLTEGVNVCLTVEQRVAGKTGYKDKDSGKWSIHTGSGLGFVNVVASTSEKYADERARKQIAQESTTVLAKDIAGIIASADPAIADAIAKALSGAFTALK